MYVSPNYVILIGFISSIYCIGTSDLVFFFPTFAGDASRQLSDLKFKLVKSEQEVTALEQNVSVLSLTWLIGKR